MGHNGSGRGGCQERQGGFDGVHGAEHINVEIPSPGGLVEGANESADVGYHNIQAAEFLPYCLYPCLDRLAALVQAEIERREA